MAGRVSPGATVIVAGDTVNIFMSLLVSVTITPSEGATAGKVMAMGDNFRASTVTVDGTEIVPALTTVIVADVSAIFGRALAWIVVLPTPAPFTTTFTFVDPGAKLTADGTVAILVSLEINWIVKPPGGAGTDRFNVKVCVAVPTIFALVGKKLAKAVTRTVRLTD